MKLLFLAILASFSLAATRFDVVPVNWSKLSGTAPTDSLSIITKKLMNNSAKYFMVHYLETLPDSAGLYKLSAYPESAHSKIREPAMGAGMMGIALSIGAYDAAVAGRTEIEARAMQTKLIKSLAAKYWGDGGSFLGGWNCWQCALWASWTGFGAWLVWEDLDTLTQTQIARMVEKESNKLNYDPPYCNDCIDDTKAEENSWMAQVITTAVAMMPNHTNMTWWKSRASQWMISSYARELDLKRNTLVDGKLPRDWIRGWNVNENGYLYNHGFTHPDYMCAITMNLYTILFQSLAGQVIPQAGIYNFDLVYNCFVNYNFQNPPFRSPGGTIYREGKANIYYPNGTDWSSARIDNHFEVDVFASILPEINNIGTIPATDWARIRADTVAWRMTRFTTGQQYAPGEWDNEGQSPWKLAEIMGGWMFSTSYLAMWLKENRKVMPIGNWHLTSPDTIPPSQPTSFSATATDMSTIVLHWNRVTDVGSGTAYYLLLRDGKEIAITKDTAYTDNNLLSGTTFSYKVFPIDLNNNKSLSPAVTSATTFSDASALSPVKAAVIDSATLNIAFSKNIDSSTASLLSNYTGEGFTISSVAVCKSGNEVLLKVSQLIPGTSYAISINFGSGATRLSFKCPSAIREIIGYWPCDERFGNTIYDKSSAGNNAIFSGTIARTPGYSAGGISLDSAKKGHALFNYVPRNVRVDFPFTISLWVKTAAISKGQTILSTEDFYGRYYGAWLDISATGEISFGIGNGGTPSPDARKNKTTTSVLAEGIWNHIAAIAKNPSDMAVYINGADAGGNYSGNASSIAHNEYGEFKIGRRISAGNVEQNFEGAVDEVKIFNSALSLEQVQELANDTSSYVQTEKGGIPGNFSFYQSPNPFNPQCKFDLVLPEASEVSLEICDVRGNLINRLIKNQLTAGKYSLVWNTLNVNGEKVSAGIYLARVKVGNDITRTKRLVLMK